MDQWDNNSDHVVNDNQQQNNEHPAENPNYGNYTYQNEQNETNQTNNQFNGSTTTYTYVDQGNMNNSTAQESKPKKVKKVVTFNLSRTALVLIIIAVLVVSAGSGALVSGIVRSNTTTQTVNKTIVNNNYNLENATGSEMTIQEIAAKNANSVVAITTNTVTTNSWIGQYVSSGAGSGVVYSAEGYIITNYHVIDNATSITVTLNNGESYSATVVASDSLEDLAVLKIDATGLTPVTFSDMSTTAVGDLAVAIGNPLGTLAGTVTEGIVSAMERTITLDGKSMTLLQTSAAISPGSSGGGLFDCYGNLIGIVVAKSSSSTSDGIGFAIPGTRAKSVVESLISKGYVSGHAAIGVEIKVYSASNASSASSDGFTVRYAGLYIVNVIGTNAKAAGFQKGDYIYKVGDTQISSRSDLTAALSKYNVGDQVVVTIVRDNQIMSITTFLEDTDSINKQN